jgi:DHA2 family methylenomycin A resistance protein-like MFS transporter
MSKAATSLPQAAGLAAVSLAFAMVQLDVTIVNVALDNMRAVMSIGVAELQWVVNGYTLAFAALLLTGGALGDRFGARRLYLLGLGLFTLASMACGLAPSGASLVAARVAQGAGAALLLPCSLALLVHMYSDAGAQARAIAVWGAAGGLAMVAGPIAGGMLISLFGWRSIFLINVPLGLLAMSITWRVISEAPTQVCRSIDLPGQVLAILMLTALTGAIIEGQPLGWSHPLILSGFVLFLVASAAFLTVEKRSRVPMVPLGMFRNATFSAASGIGVVLSCGFYGMIFLYGLYFQRRLGMSPFEAGRAFVPMTSFMAITNILAGRATVRWGARIPIVLGLLSCALGYGLLAAMLNATTTYLDIWWTLLLVGPGAALAITALTAALMATVEPARAGVASGVLNALRQTGGAIGVGILGVIGSGGTSATGMRTAAFLACGLHALAIVAAVAFITPIQRAAALRSHDPTEVV